MGADPSTREPLTLVVNGSHATLTTAHTLPEGLVELGMDPSTVLVEINGDAPPRSQWNTITLQSGDRLEILRVSAGG